MIFVGVTARWGLEVCDFLNAEFINRQWRAYTMGATFSGHNSTWLFFFGALWRMKIRVYTFPVNDTDELKHRINEAFTHVTNDMLDNTWRELYSRFQMLQANGSSRIEVYELLIFMKINSWNALLYCYVFCKSQHLKQRHTYRLSITAKKIFFRYYLSSAGCLYVSMYLSMYLCECDCSHTVHPTALKLWHNTPHGIA